MAAPLEYEVRAEYRNYSIGQLLDAPVTCFQGVGEIQSELLERYFNITTVRQLADMPSFLDALAVQETVLEGGDIINKTVSEANQASPLNFHVRVSDLGKKISELPESPIHVLEGVTPGQDLALYDAFRITNVTQMAHNRIMLEARVIDYLAKEGGGTKAEGGDAAISSILGARAASSTAGKERAMSDEFSNSRVMHSTGEVSAHVRDRVEVMRGRTSTGAGSEESARAVGPDRLATIKESRSSTGNRMADMERIRSGQGPTGGDRTLHSGGMPSRADEISASRGPTGPRVGERDTMKAMGGRADSVLAARQSLGRGSMPSGGAPSGGATVRSRPAPTSSSSSTSSKSSTSTATKAKDEKAKTLPTEQEVEQQKAPKMPPPPPASPMPWIIAAVVAVLVVIGVVVFMMTRPTPQVVQVPSTQTKTTTTTDSPATPAAVTPPVVEPKGPVIKATRKVVRGDTLWRISIREYRDPLNWPSIFMENREVIKNPDLIYPAQEFRIPANPEYRFPAYPQGYKPSR